MTAMLAAEMERAGATPHRPARPTLNQLLASQPQAGTSRQVQHSEAFRMVPSKKAAQSFLDGSTGRKVFARMLWSAFPGKSENEVAERAALVLGVSDRQCRNYLRGIHEAKASHVMAVIALLGFEKAMKLIEGKK